MTLRAGTRALTFASRRVAYQQARTVAPKRFSSSAHSAPQSGDKPWMIGSALIFVPTMIYLLSPSARSKPRHAHTATGHGEPHAPAVNAPATPPPPAPAEPTKNEETIADAEETEVPVEEVKEPIVEAVTQDSPKEAAESTKYDDGAPGQGSKAELDHEQVDEPTKSHLHDEEPRPTETKQANVPEQVAESEGAGKGSK